MATTEAGELKQNRATRPDVENTPQQRRELRHHETEGMRQDTRGNPDDMPGQAASSGPVDVEHGCQDAEYSFDMMAHPAQSALHLGGSLRLLIVFAQGQQQDAPLAPQPLFQLGIIEQLVAHEHQIAPLRDQGNQDFGIQVGRRRQGPFVN